MKNELLDEQPFVPEVDVASVRGSLAEADVTEAATTDVDDEKNRDVGEDLTEAMKRLPDRLAAHIQDLIAHADAEGYLRGRNEAIEATQHFDESPDLDLTPQQLPTYCRRSIWDTP